MFRSVFPSAALKVVRIGFELCNRMMGVGEMCSKLVGKDGKEESFEMHLRRIETINPSNGGHPAIYIGAIFRRETI